MQNLRDTVVSFTVILAVLWAAWRR